MNFTNKRGTEDTEKFFKILKSSRVFCDLLLNVVFSTEFDPFVDPEQDSSKRYKSAY